MQLSDTLPCPINMTLVKWTTPKVVRRYEWNTSGKGEMLLLVRLSIKWTVLIGVPALCAVARFAPLEAHHIALRLLIVPLMLLLQVCPHLVLQVLVGREYRLGNKGLQSTGGSSKYCICWRQIISWTIDNHPHIEGIRVLTIKAMLLRRPRIRHFSFNPRITDETCLRQMLRTHTLAQ